MFRYITSGESHGKGLTVIVEGLPSGLAVDLDRLNADLSRRQKGHGRGERMRIEHDQALFLSGIRYGETIGTPVTLHIPNRDWQNHRKVMATEPLAKGAVPPEVMTVPRPGHADLSGWFKLGRTDLRDVWERASARETAARTAAGSLARQFLETCGVKVFSHTIRIGKAGLPDPDAISVEQIEAIPSRSLFHCADPYLEKAMIAQVDRAQTAGDSLGGAFQVVATGLPPGLGSYARREEGLDSRLAGALMSIPSAKGVEFGQGVRSVISGLGGSEFHDPILFEQDPPRFHRGSNRAGGIEGGLSTGEELRVTVYMKPIPTLGKPLRSVDLSTGRTRPADAPRADVCVVPAGGVVGEAMVMLVLAEVFCFTFGGETIRDLRNNLEAYCRRLSEMAQRVAASAGRQDGKHQPVTPGLQEPVQNEPHETEANAPPEPATGPESNERPFTPVAPVEELHPDERPVSSGGTDVAPEKPPETGASVEDSVDPSEPDDPHHPS